MLLQSTVEILRRADVEAAVGILENVRPEGQNSPRGTDSNLRLQVHKLIEPSGAVNTSQLIWKPLGVAAPGRNATGLQERP